MKTMTTRKALKQQRDKLAEQSVSRGFYELHEADARVRHYKQGFDAALNLILPEIKNLMSISSKYLRTIPPDVHYEDCAAISPLCEDGDEDCDCGVVDAESNLRQALESFEWLLKEDTND